jgi:glyoxalase/bleomycin resistance protein/dioxygenase superfamily protein
MLRKPGAVYPATVQVIWPWAGSAAGAGLDGASDVSAGADTLSAMVAAAVLYVKDLAVMKTFYEECFGMSAVESGRDEFCVLASGD